MKVYNPFFLIFGLAVCCMVSCTDDVDRTVVHYTEDEYDVLSEVLDLPLELHDYGQERSNFINFGGGLFAGSESNDIFSMKNISRNHQATLGRVLFYDTKLSVNNTVSCGSCHQQLLAFADDVAFSEGFDGELSFRNSLPLGNTVGFETAYGGSSFGRALFGWDEANRDISSQSEAAITSSVEMGMHDMNALVTKLRTDEVYKVLFKKAFGTSTIHKEDLLLSLDKFINSIVSNNSKFDEEVLNNRGQSISQLDIPFKGYTDSENRGKALYNSNCASCHSMDHTRTTLATANNGLDLEYSDKGRYNVTSDLSDRGVFKIPFLRNIELTAPYMHDGRFETLEEVVEHYATGIKNHENKHPLLDEIKVTSEDKADLVAYLKTLTDPELTSDLKWSDPFK